MVREPGTGIKSVRTNAWIQLEDGLNYWDEASRTWRESREEIRIVEHGAVALTGAYRAIFSSNANDPEGAVDLRLADGLRLRSSVLALRYSDAASGKTQVLGVVRDVRGELLPPNQILYRNVFDEVRADLVYTYRKRGVEADVVLREMLPDPEEFGLIPETTHLEVVTEFFGAPNPLKRYRLLASVEDPELRARVARPDWIDEELDFGFGRIGEGRAFAWSAREAAEQRPEDYPPVGKRWVLTEDGRTLLVESVEYLAIYDALLALPGDEARREISKRRSRLWAGVSSEDLRERGFRRIGVDAGAATTGEEDRAGDGPSWAARDASWAVPRRPKALASAIEGGIRMAAGDVRGQPGLVLDWNSLAAGSSNFTFAATNTYYVTGACTFTGTTTLEGGAVIKFPAAGGPFSGIEIAGPLVCKTGPYRPAVFTADADNTVGESIVAGAPDPAADYGSRYLRVTYFGAPLVLEHLRFRHANEAVMVQANNAAHLLRHCQFVNCRLPVTSLAATAVRLQNVLIHGGKATGAVFTGPAPVAGEHVTIHQAPNLRNGGSLVLSNSVVAAVAAVQPYSGAGNWQAAVSTGLFEVVGAGSHYLPSGSPLRNAGVAGIDARLRQDLQSLTTDAPRVLGVVFGIETNLVARVRRDTDVPDIGYHYVPLDFAVGGLNLIGTTVRMTDGANLGVYGAGGLVLGAGSRFESRGSAGNPNRVAYYTQVQEQTASAWASPTGDIGLVEVSSAGSGAVPEIDWVFTEAWMPGGPANRRQWIRGGETRGLVLRSTHTQGRAVTLTVTGSQPGTSLWLTNNLLEDVEFRVSQSAGAGFYPVGLQVFNTLFRGGVVALSNGRNDSPWVLQDNLFDPLELAWVGPGGTISHNGYRAGLPAVGSFNRTGLGMDYSPSPIGAFTYPVSLLGGSVSTSLVSLLNAGSRSATVPGLHAFTSRSDSIPETNSVVDIGFHYPAAALASGGLVGHWRLDEASGGVAADSSPAARHGTLTNGPLWTAAHIGNGLNFDGINDRVTIPDAPELRITGPMTVAFWV
ncbi:MAG: hypothetical protein JNL97_05995, partial [Verrucomicrobiales bacterium]|nr:hypothetical protein [Verrucomicrobiales bacterium]